MQQFKITVVAMIVSFLLIGAALVWITQSSAKYGEELMRQRALKAQKIMEVQT